MRVVIGPHSPSPSMTAVAISHQLTCPMSDGDAILAAGGRIDHAFVHPSIHPSIGSTVLICINELSALSFSSYLIYFNFSFSGHKVCNCKYKLTSIVSLSPLCSLS